MMYTRLALSLRNVENLLDERGIDVCHENDPDRVKTRLELAGIVSVAGLWRMAHIEGVNRSQTLLLPEAADDHVGADDPVRFIDAFVDELDLEKAGFVRTTAKPTGRPGHHPGDLLKLYIYGYLNRVRSSRRLEAESHRDLEVIWLLGQLRPDFKTIADFRRDNRAAFREVFRAFVVPCRQLNLFGRELLAADAARRNLDVERIEAAADKGCVRIEDIRACEPAGIVAYVPKPKRGSAVGNGFFGKDDFRCDAENDVYVCPGDQRLDTRKKRKIRDVGLIDYTNPAACRACSLRARCTKGKFRRITRHEGEEVLDNMAERLVARPDMLRQRRESVEHPFGSIKQGMGQKAFLMRRLDNVRAEFSLTALAYDIRRVITLLGIPAMIAAVKA